MKNSPQSTLELAAQEFRVGQHAHAEKLLCGLIDSLDRNDLQLLQPSIEELISQFMAKRERRLRDYLRSRLEKPQSAGLDVDDFRRGVRKRFADLSEPANSIADIRFLSTAAVQHGQNNEDLKPNTMRLEFV